ncbi:recombinase family protein, partial [Amycolatopsis lurida]|uniref:recombinase family protein n=1 Tax=Amycolatopsis lurida TaxID=31959 RepID=UPI00365392FB
MLVWIHVKKRLFDPRNPHDRADLLTAAIKDELFSAEVSDRALRAVAANIEAGRPHGKLQFGFKRIYDAETRELIEQVHDPVKAPIIAAMFADLKAKRSINRVRDAWIAQGIFNGKGRPFAHKQIRAMALSPAYAGLRERKNPDGSTSYVKGMWDGIVSVEDFLEVKAILEDPSRRTQHDSRARHLLSCSSAASCDVCGAVLVSFNDRRGATPKYKCKPHGHVMVRRVELDELAEDAILGWLSDPKAYEPAFADRPEEEQAEVKQVRDDLAKAKAEWKDLIRRGKALEVSSAYVAEVEPALLEQIRKLEVQRDELSAPRKLVNLIKPGHGVRIRWENTPIEARREIARVVLSPEYVG